MKKIIVFDFDKTLTNYDTTLPFFVYCAKKRPIRFLLLPFFIWLMVCVKIKLLSVNRLKEVGVRLFCPLNFDEFIKMSREFSKTIELNKIYQNEFLREIDNGDNEVIIATASFGYYLPEVFENVKVVGTTFRVSKTSKKIIGIEQHPFRELKSRLLIDMGYKCIDRFYTDSPHDIYTSLISKETLWVKRGEIFKISNNLA